MSVSLEERWTLFPECGNCGCGRRCGSLGLLPGRDPGNRMNVAVNRGTTHTLCLYPSSSRSNGYKRLSDRLTQTYRHSVPNLPVTLRHTSFNYPRIRELLYPRIFEHGERAQAGWMTQHGRLLIGACDERGGRLVIVQSSEKPDFPTTASISAAHCCWKNLFGEIFPVAPH